MKEYGGYIEFEYFSGQEYHPDALALNSGRHCVEYLIRARNIRRLYMPCFLCNSVRGVCDRLGVEVMYYRIGVNLLPELEQVCAGDTWLYLVNYYGQLTNAQIASLKEKHGNVIVDNIQAFFQPPVSGIDTAYTCRKFFGVADGGYLYTDALLNEPLEQDYSHDRMEFLFGRQEKSANEFYAQYTANNRLFADRPVKRMSLATQNILRGIDYERVKQRRTENFAVLHENYQSRNRLKLTVPEGAFMYPLYIENGAAIRKQLQQSKIYIPTLWPDVFSLCAPESLEYDLAQNILPIPVDQRYDIRDMEYLVRRIEECIV